MNTALLPPSCDPEPLDSLDRPSRWLRAGFVRYEHAHGWAWISARADQPINPTWEPLSPEALEAWLRHGGTQALLQRLAAIFAEFLPITAAQWEQDLRQSPYPETLLRLWLAVLGVYDYYVTGKKHPRGAAIDYFWIIINFCNGMSEKELLNFPRRSLQPGRVRGVIDEMERWFSKRGTS